MSFDTDYLNSQKEKLNESKSNVIRLTYLFVFRYTSERAVASKLSKNLNRCKLTLCFDLEDVKVMNPRPFATSDFHLKNSFCTPFFVWECKSKSRFNTIQNYFCFYETILEKRICKELLLEFFKSGRQRYRYSTFRTKFFVDYFLTKIVNNLWTNVVREEFQKAVAKIGKFLILNKLNCNIFVNEVWLHGVHLTFVIQTFKKRLQR